MKTIDDIIEAKGSELYAMGCGQTYIGAYCDGIRFGANAVLDLIEETYRSKGAFGVILLVEQLKGE